MEYFFILLLWSPFLRFGEGQIFGEGDNKFSQLFDSVDSDISDEYFSNDYFDYDDQLTSESALSEKQVALRNFYKRRRPKFGKKAKDSTLNRIMEKIQEVNESGKNETATEKEDIFNGSDSKRNNLHRNPSGPAVTVVKPPSDFKLPQMLEKGSKVKTNSISQISDWNNKQKQRSAAATSLIGSRLKDLKEKRKIHKNSDLVTDQNTDKFVESQEKLEERLDKDFESMEEAREKAKSHLLKVHIEEKSSEFLTHISNKKRRFKPLRDPTTFPTKGTIKKTFQKHFTGIKQSVKPEETKTSHVKEEKISDIKVIEEDENEVSDELLDEVYGKLDGLYDKVNKLKETEKAPKERKPDWINKQMKKSEPLKKINAEESAQPLSVIPHGVPLSRGFPGTDHVKQLLKSSHRPEKLAVSVIPGFSDDELAELGQEHEKMSAKMINKNIEEILKIQMPKHTKLLYGPSTQRFERNPDAAEAVGKPYSFNYSILDEDTGVTHSRDESSDERGVVRGSYEVREEGCIIRRVEYQADNERGFQTVTR